ncbi:hypothetical protein RBEAN4_0152 [Rickettsia bellii str. RML An4]|uniref:Uncharacterized protein n=1 Tax=Rickettsia bellii str. RML An4 TaxID=1359193 RepID=A0A0F3QAD3_RICBE|nr:hypothetical protein RBEAN4_0152 [Rickettsia bellii str. RML An4]
MSLDPLAKPNILNSFVINFINYAVKATIALSKTLQID